MGAKNRFRGDETNQPPADHTKYAHGSLPLQLKCRPLGWTVSYIGRGTKARLPKDKQTASVSLDTGHGGSSPGSGDGLLLGLGRKTERDAALAVQFQGEGPIHLVEWDVLRGPLEVNVVQNIVFH